MREIKFRWYDNLNNTMEPVIKIRFEYGKVQEIWLRNGSSIDFMNGDGRFKLMEFTGQYDKNGKEIYEGDICKCIDSYGEEYITNIWFQDGVFLIDVHNSEYDITAIGFALSNDIEELEVIGNTYENIEVIS